VARVNRRGWTHEELVAGIRAGDRRALARAISLVEDRDPAAEAVVREVFPHTGRAYTVGVTGPPGVGKSTLVGALVAHARQQRLEVGVVSVDPSSPFSQGALLGDRIRLADHFLDPGVYIRSMGTRGHLGGLAEATLQAMLLLDAAGKDVLFLETVGSGQSEVEVVGIADVVLLVLLPGSGDAVQALKAGIMEIPDVIAVNKMDHPAAQTMLGDVRAVVALEPEPERRPAVLLTEAVRGEGVLQLWEALQARRAELEEGGRLEQRRQENLEGEVLALAAGRARERLERAAAHDPAAHAAVAAVRRRELDPLGAAQLLLGRAFGGDGAA
jgi:LAO/AO transport system kinase